MLWEYNCKLFLFFCCKGVAIDRIPSGFLFFLLRLHDWLMHLFLDINFESYDMPVELSYLLLQIFLEFDKVFWLFLLCSELFSEEFILFSEILYLMFCLSFLGKFTFSPNQFCEDMRFFKFNFDEILNMVVPIDEVLPHDIWRKYSKYIT